MKRHLREAAGEGLLRKWPWGSEPNGKPQGSAVTVKCCPLLGGRGRRRQDPLPREEGRFPPFGVGGGVNLPGGRGLDKMTSKGSLPGQLRFPSPFSVVVSFRVFHASVYLPEPRLRLSVSESLRSGPEFLMVMFCVSIVAFVFTFLEA